MNLTNRYFKTKGKIIKPSADHMNNNTVSRDAISVAAADSASLRAYIGETFIGNLEPISSDRSYGTTIGPSNELPESFVIGDILDGHHADYFATSTVVDRVITADRIAPHTHDVSEVINLPVMQGFMPNQRHYLFNGPHIITINNDDGSHTTIRASNFEVVDVPQER